MAAEAKDWNEFAKNLLKSEMKKVGFTYKNLVEALEQNGVSESEANLRNKISRGGFSAGFFFQTMNALGAGFIVLDPFASRPKGDLPAEAIKRGKVSLVRDFDAILRHPRLRKE